MAILSDVKIFRFKLKILNFLDHPKNGYQVSYHAVMFAFTFIVFILSLLDIESKFSRGKIFFITYIILEMVLLTLYSIEFCLRVWVCTIYGKYFWRHPSKYLFTPYMIIDIIILVTAVPLIIILFLSFGTNYKWYVLALKFTQFLRIFRFERYYGSVSSILKVLKIYRLELFTGYCCAILLMILTSFAVYLIEKNSPLSEIHTFADSMYFTTISFMTIGYGDLVPSSFITKIIIVSTAFVGIAFASVPSAIVGSGFAIQASKRVRKKSIIKSAKPATILLQRVARCFLYESKIASPTEQRDYKAALHNYNANIFNTQKISITVKDDVFYATARPNWFMDEFAALTSSHQDENQSDKNESPLYKILSSSTNKKNSQNKYTYYFDQLKTPVKIAALFIRHLQLMVSLEKFQNFKHPRNVHEAMDLRLNEEEKILNNLDKISSDAFFIQLPTSISEQNIKNFSHENYKNLHLQLNEIFQKVHAIDRTVHLLCEKYNSPLD